MTTRDHLLDLFRYNDWANRRVLEALRPLAANGDAPEFDRMTDLLSHLLRSQAVWLGRVQSSDEARLPFWHRDDLDACARRSETSTADWLRHLEGQTDDDLEAPLRYHNSKGHAFASTLRQIGTHVVNHASYHRAQIALRLRSVGVEPPATDYIVYARRGQQTDG